MREFEYSRCQNSNPITRRSQTHRIQKLSHFSSPQKVPNCISTWPSPNFVTLQAQLFSHFCLKNFEKRVEWKALLSSFLYPPEKKQKMLSHIFSNTFLLSICKSPYLSGTRSTRLWCLPSTITTDSPLQINRVCILLSSFKKRFKIGYSIKLP